MDGLSMDGIFKIYDSSNLNGFCYIIYIYTTLKTVMGFHSEQSLFGCSRLQSNHGVFDYDIRCFEYVR